MNFSRVSRGTHCFLCTAVILVILLLIAPDSALGQYQSVPWGDPVSGGSSASGSESEEEEERNLAKRISITIDKPYVPIPGRGDPQANFYVTVNASGDKGPVIGASVRLEVVGPASDFVSAPGGFSMEQPVTNGSGRWGTTFYVSTPSNLDLSTFPTHLQIKATLSDKDGHLGSASRTFPLGAILIHGATVGPTDPTTPLDMKGRREPPPTSLWNGLIHSSSRENGEFFVLTKIPTRKMKLTLIWPDSQNCHLPLKYVVEISPVPNMSLTLPKPIELLSPEEHQNRIKAMAKEFINTMPLTGSARSRLLSSLDQLPFTTSASGGVPSYQSSSMNMLGQIQLPGGGKTYWSNNLLDVAGSQTDPAYAIIFHEMGHFVHQQLIESCRLKLFYSIDKYLGSAHSTWSAPASWFTSAKDIVSFNESTADFFAYLLYIFVEASHPEFIQSDYYNRSYLSEFDTPAKARSVSSTEGCRIEGVQTSFLRALYGDQVKSSPAAVYSDYLRIMLQYEDDSWLTPWIPARTIGEWIGTKGRHSTMPTTGKPSELARQFNIMPCDKQPQILINPTRATGSYTVNGRRVDVTPKSEIGSLLIGDKITIHNGTFSISNVNPETAQFTVIKATPGATFSIVSPNEIYVSAGLIGVKGPVTISSPHGRSTPQGTAWTIEVAESGDAEIKVFAGSVRTENARGSTIIDSGSTALVRQKKIERGTFDPTDPAVASIFVDSEAETAFTDNSPPPPVATVSTVPDSPAPPAVAPAQTGGLTFYAVRQKATGQCLVVAGTEGITPGDTVYGAYPAFQQAQDILMRQCIGGQPAPLPPAPVPTSPTTSTSTTPPPNADSTFASPILAVPKYDNDESTKGIFFINLDGGNAFFIDKVKDSPQSVRSRALNQNIFEVLGRQPGESARHGQVLIGPVRNAGGTVHALFLVDTTSGRMGYITHLGNRSSEGRLKPVNGSPAQSMASDDGKFVLIMRQDPSGSTDGAILYHGTSGNSAYFNGIGELSANLRPTPTNVLPRISGGVSAVAILGSNEATNAVLLLDEDKGSLIHVSLPRKRPWEFKTSILPMNLFDVLPKNAEVETPNRIVTIPITSGSDETRRAVIIDVGSGEIAGVRALQDYRKIEIVSLNKNIYTRLTKDVGRPRVITAVPKVDGSGQTEAAWLFDSATGKILYLEDLYVPKNLRIRTVEEKAQ